jgi:hypothetical protein
MAPSHDLSRQIPNELDRHAMGAVAALSPYATLRGIQDHIVSRGLAKYPSTLLLDALERLEAKGFVLPRRAEPDDDRDRRFPKVVIYYDDLSLSGGAHGGTERSGIGRHLG